MVNGNLKRAEYLRRRARELTLIANEMRADHQRDILLACAHDFEQLAKMQEPGSKD